MGSRRLLAAAACAAAFAHTAAAGGTAAPALEASAWDATGSVWLSSPDAKVFRGKVSGNSNSEPGTDWFIHDAANAKPLKSVRWMTAGLGVYELFVNGKRVGDDFLKPGCTHNAKTKYAFTYDVTDLVDTSVGAKNRFVAEVSAGWWRDKIASPGGRTGFAGSKSAFRGVLEFVYADGTRELSGTSPTTWRAATGGPVVQADIFAGETYDARLAPPGDGELKTPETNREFKGEILPTHGAEIVLRRDLAAVRGPFSLKKGEKLVVDFGQNCAAVPEFRFKAARGTTLDFLPGEMLNDADKGQRGCDGPKGSVYRANLRTPDVGMRVRYTFAGEGEETYIPRFTFFGYRYAEISANGDVEIASVASIPVTSIKKEMERGSVSTGLPETDRLAANVYWGQLSNYLGVPTDCPQRNERLGWAADTQVFCETALYNADVKDFLRKWMRDMRDSQDSRGGFPGVAPDMQYGGSPMRVGWADAGVVVPHTVWRQTGDTTIIDENWNAMERFMARMAETRYRTENLPECGNYQWNDWLSLTRYESAPYKPELSAFEHKNGKRIPKPEALAYWDYLGGCHWVRGSRMMAEMAQASGRADDAAKYAKMEADARKYMAETFFPDGKMPEFLRGMQTPALFALDLGLVSGEGKKATIAGLEKSFADAGGTFHTGFLGTPILLKTLTDNGLGKLAWDLFLNRKFPGWLYSVDQGATTVWERWNSYTKKDGFGPVSMNSFNHYAYGCVMAWVYGRAAGILPGSKGGYAERFTLAPHPDARLKRLEARLKTPGGEIASRWEYSADGRCEWRFTVPRGTVADVDFAGVKREYGPGEWQISAIDGEKGLKAE